MTTTTHSDTARKSPSFDTVARPFLQQEGLPFAGVLDAATIAHAFADQGALFATDDIYSTPVVLWAFLAQALRDGKGAACAAAVADITAYQNQIGAAAPCGDTGDYCRARAKLDPDALRCLVLHIARALEDQAPDAWLWRGRHAKLVDGFTFTMPDTPANQAAFPQMDSQAPGVGFPIARACVILSLATAAICDMAYGPYQGKATGETALLRQMLGSFDAGDVAVFDRYYCSYMMVAQLRARGVEVCMRLHQRRHSDFREGRRLGHDDHIVTWHRPVKPPWMTDEDYAEIPLTLTLRELRFEVTEPGRRVATITVVTTLLDPAAQAAEAVAELYGFRWNVELDIRHTKQTLGLDHLRCQTPAMVDRELWVTLLAYNLIRKLIATAAAVHDKKPRQVGFTLACQSVLSSWLLLATDTCRDRREHWAIVLAQVAANEVANRPGRIEPRVLKRRRHRFPLMTRPRDALRKELAQT
jgi:hypothetical protein